MTVFQRVAPVDQPVHQPKAAFQPPEQDSGHRFDPQRRWAAALSLGFDLRNDGPGSTVTRLARRKHHGPLRVQRPFYPEGRNGCCHVYLLHPRVGWSAVTNCVLMPLWKKARTCY